MNKFMKTLRLPVFAGTALLLAAALYAADLTKFTAKPGSKVKIDGTSTVHDWTVEGGIIAGAMELDPAFTADPTKAKPGKLEAKVEATIPVRTIKSGKSSMDTIMHGALKQPLHPQIKYRLTELTLKETPKSADAPWEFDSKGELTVAGVTNKVAFPVTMTRADKTIKTTGTTSVKMTSFGIQPPAPSVALGLIKTGDDVKLTFEWVTGTGDAK
jgi:polyisoprenoid-binding protein YceI